METEHYVMTRYGKHVYGPGHKIIIYPTMASAARIRMMLYEKGIRGIEISEVDDEYIKALEAKGEPVLVCDMDTEIPKGN